MAGKSKKQSVTQAILKLENKLKNVRVERDEIKAMIDDLTDRAEASVKKVAHKYHTKCNSLLQIESASQELDSCLDKLFSLKSVFYSVDGNDSEDNDADIEEADDEENNNGITNRSANTRVFGNGMSENGHASLSLSSVTSSSQSTNLKSISSQLSKEENELLEKIFKRESSQSNSNSTNNSNKENANKLNNNFVTLKSYNKKETDETHSHSSIETSDEQFKDADHERHNKNDVNEDESVGEDDRNDSIMSDFSGIHENKAHSHLKPKSLSTEEFGCNSDFTSNLLITKSLNHSFPNELLSLNFPSSSRHASQHQFQQNNQQNEPSQSSTHDHDHRPSLLARTPEMYNLISDQEDSNSNDSISHQIADSLKRNNIVSINVLEVEGDSINNTNCTNSSDSDYMTPCSESIYASLEAVSDTTLCNSPKLSQLPDLISIQEAYVEIGNCSLVTFATVISPAEFYIHLDADAPWSYIDVIQDAQKKLIMSVDEDYELKYIYKGMFCAALYSEDVSVWYRARVDQVIYDNNVAKEVIVHYIDWGNSEKLPVTSIMKLSQDLNQPMQAVRCSLFDCDVNHLNPNVIAFFKDLTTKANINVKFVKAKRLGDIFDGVLHYYVQLIDFQEFFHEDFNINDIIMMKEASSSVNNQDDNADKNMTEVKTTLIEIESEVESHNNSSTATNIIERTPEPVTSNAKPIMKSPSPSDSIPVNSKKLLKALEERQRQQASESDINLSSEQTQPSTTLDPPNIPVLTLPNSDYLLTAISTIHDPSHFYLHLINPDSDIDNSKLDDLLEQMQSFYSIEANRKEVKDVSKVVTNSYWSCIFKDNQWFRVRVLYFVDTPATKKTIESELFILYIDYGNILKVKIKDLKYLDAQFCKLAALAIKCSLSGISPLDEQDHWSDDAVSAFQEISGVEDESILTTYINNAPNKIDFDTSFEVFLWRSFEEEDGKNRDMLINAQLVLERYAMTENMDWVEEAERANRENTPPRDIAPKIAQLIGINKSGYAFGQDSIQPIKVRYPEKRFPERLVEEDEEEEEEPEEDYMLNWDPMKDDALCDRNNYQTKDDDPAMATMGFRPNDERLCRFYLEGKCKRGDLCEFKHIPRETKYQIRDNEEEVFDVVSPYVVPDGSALYVKVSAIQSPSSFYAILLFGNKSASEDAGLLTLLNNEVAATLDLTCISPDLMKYKEMCSQMKAHYTRKIAQENAEIFHGVGSLVACKCAISGEFFRGRVIENNDDMKCCKVQDIDGGAIHELPRSSVFKMLNFFCSAISNLAVQCSLAGIEAVEEHRWSQEAIDEFKRLTLGNNFVAHFVKKEEMADKYEVILTGYIGDEEVVINELLTRNNLVKSRSQHCFEASSHPQVPNPIDFTNPQSKQGIITLHDDDIYLSENDLD